MRDLLLGAVVIAAFAFVAPTVSGQQPGPGGSPLPSGQPTGPGAQPGDRGPSPQPGETGPSPSGPTTPPPPPATPPIAAPEQPTPRTPPLPPPAPPTGPAGASGLLLPTTPSTATPAATHRAVLALSLKEAIVRGLRHNPELAIDRISVEIAQAGIEVPRGRFDPIAFSDGSYGKNRDPFFSANPFGGAINPATGLAAGLLVNPSEQSRLDGGLRVPTVLGTSFEFRYDISRRTTANINALNPSWTPVGTASIVQPLLRGFGLDVNRALITIASNDLRVTEEAFRDRALSVAFSIEQAYWTFVFTRENLKVAELALATAKDLLEINRRKFQVGRVAEIEVLVAETGVATREEAVIVARNDVLNARDGLFRLIMPRTEAPRGGGGGAETPRSRASAWDLELVALDEPRADDRVIDLEKAYLLALKNRPDYRQLEIALESDDTRIDQTWNAQLPRFDATASWSQIGLGKSWGGATNAQLDGDYYDWAVGFNFEVPIFDTTPRAQHRQAELGRAATRRRLDALEQQIVLDVRTAVRNVAASRERTRATDVARQLAERQLDNERQRLEAGLATNHDVLLFEQDLTAARTNYIKALVDRAITGAQLDRVTATLLDRYDVRVER